MPDLLNSLDGFGGEKACSRFKVHSRGNMFDEDSFVIEFNNGTHRLCFLG